MREVLYKILIDFGVPMKLVTLIEMCLNETYSKVHICKRLYEGFPIQNGLIQGDALSPLLFNFALEYAIRKVQEKQVGLKWNGTHWILSYADDVHVLGDNTDKKVSNIFKGTKPPHLTLCDGTNPQNYSILVVSACFEICMLLCYYNLMLSKLCFI
jgi:hypothetical protein